MCKIKIQVLTYNFYLINFRRMRKRINLIKLSRKLSTVRDQVNFLQKHEIFKTSVNCKCGSKSTKLGKYVFRFHF